MHYKITQDTTGLQFFQSEEPLLLSQGGELSQWTLAFETYGTLNDTRSNALLIHHALSTHSHLAAHDRNTQAGWWENMVGPGKPLDTNHYFVICINNLGSCFGSTGPTSLNPATGRPYGPDFPAITFKDMVKAQVQLLEPLGIHQLYAIVSASMGAMISLEWAINYPETLEKLVLVSSSCRAYPMNCANRAIQREIIRLDPMWAEGHYQKRDLTGFKIARKIGHLYYRHSDELNQRFAYDNQEIESYLEYNANKFITRFDANSYLSLLGAMDEFDVGRDFGGMSKAFGQIKAKCLVVSVDSDTLFPVEQQQEIVNYMQQQQVEVNYFPYQCSYGHDTFLVDTAGLEQSIKTFLGKK